MKRQLLLNLTIITLILSSFSATGQYFTPIWTGNGYETMAVIVDDTKLDGVDIQVGDSIAVLDFVNGDLSCVGAEKVTYTITSTTPLIIVASADDGSDNGFTVGESIIYLIWDNSESKIISLIDSVYANGYNQFYEQKGTTLVSLTSFSSNTWDGSTDNDWTDPGNWSTGIATDMFADVVIPSGLSIYPTITAAAECNDLTIKSDATGNGSILGNDNLNVNGTTILERYFEGYNGGSNGWHNISSPVDDMVITGSSFDFPDPSDDDLYRWNEALNIWENYKGTGFTNFENGRGYLCALHTTATLSFMGTLNEDNVTHTNLTNSVGGFHLLGNPFASALEWNNGDWNIAGNNVGAVAQIWDESNNGYALLNADAIIPSTNGFFVEVSSATNTITIPSSARVHDATNNYKGSMLQMQDALELVVSNNDNTYTDLNRIGFKSSATEEWDVEYDAHKLFGGSDAPQLWTEFNEEIFSQNFLPFTLEPYQVNLNFSAGTNSTHQLTANGINSFSDDIDVYLEDLFTEEIIHLNQQSTYEFIASTEDDSERFIVHFYGVTGLEEDMQSQNSIHIYSNNNTLYFKFKDLPKKASQLEVFNTMGQLVYSGSIEPNSLSSIDLNEKTGIYIVKVKTENGIVTNKVMIK